MQINKDNNIVSTGEFSVDAKDTDSITDNLYYFNKLY